jgi:O-acetyl-ADP-ribose deacetylase (regulator of RNase III)
MAKFNVICGDITKAKVDVVVNAAKTSLSGGSGVDGAIHKAAGQTVLQECLALDVVDGVRCPTGEARITKAGNLNCKYIIHTVGPIYSQHEKPKKFLKLAYVNSIELALKNGCKSIAFPAISCGKYGYPHSEAVDIALSTLVPYLDLGISIYFYIFEHRLYQMYLKKLGVL